VLNGPALNIADLIGKAKTLAVHHTFDADGGFGLVAPKCQLYGRPYMRTDLRKTDRTLQVSPVATQCGQKTAYDRDGLRSRG
jgi:hypothetical protein